MKKTMISVIIPVYNAEKTLNQCVDSLVYQTVDDGYEILIAEKSSTDASLQIAERYEKEFPNKVRVLRLPYTPNPARALNIGAREAKGDFLCFCDPDDYFELNAMAVIQESIIQNDCDMTFFDAKVVDHKGYTRRKSRIATPLTKENLLIKTDFMTYWRTVIRRSFFLSQPPIIENCRFADVSWIPLFIDKAESITQIQTPLYNYNANNGFSSASDRSSTKFLESLIAWNYLLDNISENLYDATVMFIALRLAIQLKKFWNIREKILEWLLPRKDIFLNNKYIKGDNVIYNILYTHIMSVPETFVPKNIYLNGFSKLSKNYIDYIQENTFVGGEGNIVVLDESNCDLSELPYARKALEEGRYDYVGHYFALKNIYEKGGFFIGDNITFVANLDCKRRYSALFSYFDENSFTDEIFGAVEKNDVIFKLLRTYRISDFYEDRYFRLAGRIRNILSAVFDINIDGRYVTTKGINICDPTIFVVDAGADTQISYMDFSKQKFLTNYITVPESIFNMIKEGKFLRKQNMSIEAKNIKQELDDIKRSDSYKLALRLRKMGNSKWGRPFKMVFKWFIKKYRRFKYRM